MNINITRGITLASLRWDGAPHISLRCVRFAGESDNIRLEFPRLWCRVGGWTSTLTLGGATELWFSCKWRLRSELFIFFDVLQTLESRVECCAICATLETTGRTLSKNATKRWKMWIGNIGSNWASVTSYCGSGLTSTWLVLILIMSNKL